MLDFHSSDFFVMWYYGVESDFLCFLFTEELHIGIGCFVDLLTTENGCACLVIALLCLLSPWQNVRRMFCGFYLLLTVLSAAP